MPEDGSVTRRPLKTRATAWARFLASALAKTGVTPNAISICSIICAVAAGTALYLSRFPDEPAWRCLAFIIAAGCIQLRLLCNMLDGMVAIEGGLQTPTGEFFNEAPDRLADVVILVPLGYCLADQAWLPELAWTAAALALATAYIRALGASCDGHQDFCGPLAKPQRMAIATLSCLAAGIALFWQQELLILQIALVLLVSGTAATVLRRCWRLYQRLHRSGS